MELKFRLITSTIFVFFYRRLCSRSLQKKLSNVFRDTANLIGYNRVSHYLCLFCFSFSSSLLEWIHNYLTNTEYNSITTALHIFAGVQSYPLIIFNSL